MIDYYYEFEPENDPFKQPTRYAVLRGYHPGESLGQTFLHNLCYSKSTRVWLENANGMTLIREHGRDTHKKINRSEMVWIKLVAREI